MNKDQVNLGLVKKRLREFASERDWEQFHSPKNLAMALSVEASELVELFQWAEWMFYDELGREVPLSLKNL